MILFYTFRIHLCYIALDWLPLRVLSKTWVQNEKESRSLFAFTIAEEQYFIEKAIGGDNWDVAMEIILIWWIFVKSFLSQKSLKIF